MGVGAVDQTLSPCVRVCSRRLINPQRACAARVTVVAVSVCVCVCPLNVNLSNKCTHSTRTLENWAHADIKGGCRANNRPNMAPKFKKEKKTRELADRYTVVLAQRSTYTGNYKALQPPRTMKRLTNTVWAVKTWSCYLNGRVWWSAVVVQARGRWQQ